jgi:hypothetical protein
MILSRLAVWAVGLALVPDSAAAGSLALAQKERWLVVASTKDVDSAIGIAGHYSAEEPRVVEAKNGWFAVVMGPYRAKSMAELMRRRADLPTLPQDALLSRGGKYQQTVWEHARKRGAELTSFTPQQPLKLSVGELQIKVAVAKPKSGENVGPTTLTGKLAGRPAFNFSFGNAGDSEYGMSVGIIRLDPATEYPQIVLTRYSGGAHCCTQTWIATKPKGATGWILLDAGSFDGDGYGYYDLNGDGAHELVNIDNSFLYAFDSYAGSFAPVNYQGLDGGVLRGLSNDDIAGHAIRQDLAALEFSAKLDPGNWKRNGYLAAWVASKIRLGQGDDAWATMLENFDKSTDFNQQECLTGAEVETCPEVLLSSIPFPQALARFLSVTGYGPLPESAVQ